MPTFSNGESAATVRSKLNNSITRTDFCVMVKDVTQLANLVYTTASAWTVAAGDSVVTAKEGFNYTVLASGASTFDLQPGAVKLEALPTSAGHFNFDCMLPAGNGVTDDYAKLKKLLDKIAYDPGGGLFYASPAIYFPPKRYYMSQTLELKQTVHLRGSMGTYPNAVGSTLVFPANTTGIVINRTNTNEAGLTTTTTGADWTTIESLGISGGGGTDKTRPGILLRARAAIRSVAVGGFSGNGISIIAGAGTGGASEGNANLWYVQNVNCSTNGGWGFYVDGADTNAGNAIALDCTRNGRGGIWDSSFLGNTYIGCHTATNGLATAGGNTSAQSSYVTFGGNRYAAHWTATEAELVATEPGTDATVWIVDDVGGTHPTIPLWQAGQPEGTYFVAFSYYSDGNSSRNKFINCYSEGGSAGSVLIGSSHFDGGILHRIYAGGQLQSDGGGSNWLASAFSAGIFNAGDGVSTNLMAFNSSTTSLPWRFQVAGNNLVFRNGNLGNRNAFFITGDSDPLPYRFSVGEYLLNGKRVTNGTAAPTTGTYARGDRVENSAPSAGGFAGWVCVTAGTPGTWKGYGVIEA